MEDRFIRSMDVIGAFFQPKDITKTQMTISGSKNSLRDIHLLNLQLMVTRSKSNLKKVLSTLKLIKEIINPWK